eukprot:CAMPEP_0182898574 /NCGR_PEP_ID=MMETSP0034_2-20130328/27569_1 /TAXON_ID=156128 /ORGANISM="Nephroselmis pyriformis, Strain CCMP717" /LENGTH=67 /DNA_ID=CAMNT_0025032555 /DNA_START=1 /DNA_END=204 /DNA_ORIENTATION=+
MWAVMLSCWAMAEDDRPTFVQLRGRLIKLLNAGGSSAESYGIHVPATEDDRPDVSADYDWDRHVSRP